jgi:hypothetical protein
MIFRRKGVLELQRASRSDKRGQGGALGETRRGVTFRGGGQGLNVERSVYVEVNRVSKDEGR